MYRGLPSPGPLRTAYPRLFAFHYSPLCQSLLLGTTSVDSLTFRRLAGYRVGRGECAYFVHMYGRLFSTFSRCVVLGAFSACGLLLVGPFGASAQDKSAALAARGVTKPISFRDAVTGGTPAGSLGVVAPRGFQWLSARHYAYRQAKPSAGWAIETVGSPSSNSGELFGASALNKWFGFAGDDTLKALPELTWQPDGSYSAVMKGKLYRGKFAPGSTATIPVATSTPLPAGHDNLDVHPSGAAAFTQGPNLFIMHPTQGLLTLSASTDSNIIYGGNYVHRQEFGISKGTFWSPDGSRLAYYRLDQTMVADVSILQLTANPTAAKNTKYPMAGRTSHHATVYVYNVGKRQAVMLATAQAFNDPEQYSTNISFSPDGNTVFVQMLNRGQNHLKVQAFDANTGALKATLYEEKHDKYVEPLHALTFVRGSNNRFVAYSAKSGHTHLYSGTYEAGKPVNLTQITSGDFDVTDLLGFSDKGEVIFQATNEQGLGRAIYAQGMDAKSGKPKGKLRTLTPQPGTHTAVLSPDGKHLIDQYSSRTVPRNTQLIRVSDAVAIDVIHQAANPWEGQQMGQVRVFQIKGADGKTPLWCRAVLPTNFDSTRKYPSITYLYNGPHVQLVTNTWGQGANLWYHALAQRGYVVFTVDGRGSEGRGQEFEQATFRQLGTVEMQDQLAGSTLR